ncbi:centrosomal protein of 78 kDa-like isoform X2 [Watersipora subatra]|uniref:centrosomal protein of 78 kDa-like isoform X2 n=1 Tax=Watersipora subatra TaxID=2589382 RepID=UPI00355C8FFC
MPHSYHKGRTGIETVHERGQGAHQFGLYYDNLCALQSSVPLTNVKACLDQNILQINADKIRLTDWTPILKALRINKSLQKVSIYSHYEAEQEPMQTTGSRTPSMQSHTPSKQKVPAAHSKEITYQICKAVRDCLTCSERLRCVELEGLPFRPRDIHLLAKGIMESCSLKELSLDSSCVGDTLSVLCEGLKNASTVNMINLSGCGLADGSMEVISKVVKHQAIMRHSEAWKSSLRYRAPDLDCMPGLRRITLNRNPLLGDDAAKAIADALKDDLWLKAVDLQECGLTDAGAEYLLNALRLNSTLLIMDIRGNHMVSRSLVERVIQQVMINSDNKSTQFSWLPVDGTRQKTSMIRSSSQKLTKKSPPKFITHAKSKTLVISPSCKRLAAAAASPPVTSKNIPKQRGLPWRTAERASIHKPVEEGDHRNTNSIQRIHLHNDENDDGSLNSERSFIKDLTNSSEKNHSIDRETLAILKDLQAENISLKRRLAEESTARLAAEDRALESARENRHLQLKLRKAALTDSGADEELLSHIEAAFNKFNQFLDLVRDTGLGHLIQEAGLDTFAGTSSPIPSPSRRTEPNSFTSRTSSFKDEGDSSLKRRIALQSDDIIQPVPITDQPPKSYAEIVAGNNIQALATALKKSPSSDKQPSKSRCQARLQQRRRRKKSQQRKGNMELLPPSC